MLPVQLSPQGTGKFCSCSTRKGCPTRRSPSVWGCRFPPAAPGSPGPESTAAPICPIPPVFPIERCFDVSYYFLRPPRRGAAPAPGDDLIPGGNLPAPPPGASDDPGGPAAPRFFRRGILAAAAGHPSRLLPPSPRPRLEAMGPGGKRRGPWPPWSSFSPPRQRRAPPRPPPFPRTPSPRLSPRLPVWRRCMTWPTWRIWRPPLPARTWRTFPFSSPETPPRAIFPLTQRTKPNLSFFWRTLPFPRPPSPRILFKTSRQSPPHRKRRERFPAHSFQKSKEDAPAGARPLSFLFIAFLPLKVQTSQWPGPRRRPHRRP